MTLVGTSAPASGGEHLLSHTLDMMAAAHGHDHDLHGRQVGLGTILSAALYERVLGIESPQWIDPPPAIDGTFWSRPTVIEAVAKQYAAKQESFAAARETLSRRGEWDRLRARLASAVTPLETIRDWLKRAGGATTPQDIGCPRGRLRDAVLHMHEIRQRFTIVDLAWLVGILPGQADELIDRSTNGPR
jgi:glycerol-1-phosphate dehydrogenase [NAD(P)+]